MPSYSRSISIQPFTLRPGDLVRLLEAVEKKALGSVGHKCSVSRHEKLPDGTSVSHEPAGLESLMNVCTMVRGSEIRVRWTVDKEDLVIGFSTYTFSDEVMIGVFTYDPRVLNAALSCFEQVFDPDEDVAAAPKDEPKSALIQATTVQIGPSPKSVGSEVSKPPADSRATVLAAWIGVLGTILAAALTAYLTKK